MRALSNKLQKQSEDLDRKLASDDSTSLALVVRNMNTKQTKSNRSPNRSTSSLAKNSERSKGQGGKQKR